MPKKSTTSKKSSSKGKAADASVISPGGTVRVLIIEDNDSDAHLLRETLEGADSPKFEVLWADSMAAALEELTKAEPDVILLDLRLPDTDPQETIDSLTERKSDTPILVVTAVEEQQLAMRALELGAQDYLIKGNMDSEHMVRAIRYAMERAKSRAALSQATLRLSTIMDTAAEGICGIDLEGNIAFMNVAGARMIGWPVTDLVGKNAHDTFHYAYPDGMDYPAHDSPFTACVTEQQTYEVDDEVFWRRDGTSFPVAYTASPVPDHSASLGAVLLFRDLTHERRAEEVIRRQREEMMELSTPVIQIWDHVLALPIVGTLDSARTQRVMETLLEEVALREALIVIIDVSGVPAIDSLISQHLLRTMRAAKLMGVQTIISGIRAETAQTMVHLGVEFQSVLTRRNLRDSLKLAFQLLSGDPHQTKKDKNGNQSPPHRARGLGSSDSSSKQQANW